MPPSAVSESPRICWAGEGSACVRAPASFREYAGRKIAAPSARRGRRASAQPTLIHDDVIDSADTRRAASPIQMGQSCSVLAGDWLYMQSFQMALEERNFRILDILIDLTRKMVEGELIQLQKSAHRRDRRRCAAAGTYKSMPFQRLRSPRRSAGRFEARRAGARRLREIRGLAFQLVDDLLDFTASAEQLGKPVSAI